MTIASFYETFAGICFTLLGLWWVVVRTSHETWAGDPNHRRTATHISLYFLLPGFMSLLAILPAEAIPLWRMSFGVASILGLLETRHLLTYGAQRALPTLLQGFRWVAPPLYALILVVAFDPGLPRRLDVEPLLVTGIALTLIMILGVCLAWYYFIEPPTETEGEG